MIGYRHTKGIDGRPECNCGCQHVVGLDGTIREDDDTPKLKELGYVYVDFQTPYGEKTICYDYAPHAAHFNEVIRDIRALPASERGAMTNREAR